MGVKKLPTSSRPRSVAVEVSIKPACPIHLQSAEPGAPPKETLSKSAKVSMLQKTWRAATATRMSLGAVRGRGRGRSERSEEDRDIPKEYRPPREFKGGRGRGRGEGREARDRDRDRDAGRGSGGRESRQGRGVFRRSGPPPSEDNSNNDS